MAGRGCNITIQVLQDDGQVEDVALPVALHTPLFVLKGQLRDMVDIPIETQVLILCDLSDPDRNSDVLLDNDDFVLRECGIRDGSVLTLHRLGANIPPPPDAAVEAEEEEDNDENVYNDVEHLKEAVAMGGHFYSLSTRTSAARADHSYNGVVFDMKALGAFEVHLSSVSLAGMLGRVVRYDTAHCTALHFTSLAWSRVVLLYMLSAVLVAVAGLCAPRLVEGAAHTALLESLVGARGQHFARRLDGGCRPSLCRLLGRALQGECSGFLTYLLAGWWLAGGWLVAGWLVAGWLAGWLAGSLHASVLYQLPSFTNL
jgi:hypothetical protein